MGSHFFGVPPQRSGGLVGRQDVVARGSELLLSDEDVSLLGLGGVGKSALANALVRVPAVRARFPDVFWLGVGRSHHHGEPVWRLQLMDWARALGAPQDRIAAAERAGTPRLLALVTEGLGASTALLVFDDVWLETEALMLKDLGSECRRVLTTRVTAAADRFSPAGLLPVHDLSQADALTLFNRLAPLVARRSMEAARQCVSVVAGLPLAVVIVAAYMQERITDDPTSFQTALAEVLDVNRRLEMTAGIAESQITRLPQGTAKTLDAVIGLSAGWLSETERSALTSLTSFPPKLNSFSFDAAQAVTESRQAVNMLRRYSLVEDQDNDANARRLTMHQTVHDYAKRGTAGDPDAYRRMAEYFLEYITTQQRTAENSDAWLSALAQEQDNIRMSLTWTIDNQATVLAYRLMGALWDYWYRRSLYMRAKEFADRLLSMTVAEQSDDFLLLRAKLLNDAGNYAYNMADLADAENRHREALEIRSSLNDNTVAGSWNNLGLVLRERGRYLEAHHHFETAIDLSTATGNDYWRGLHLDNIGVNSHRAGDLIAGETQLRAAEAIFSGLGDHWGCSMTNIDLGLVLVDQNRLPEAAELLTSSLDDRWTIGDKKLCAAALRGLAAVADAERAVTLLSASVALTVPILDRLGEHRTLMALTSAYCRLGNHQMAARVHGILEELRAATGLTASPSEQQAMADAVQRSRDALGESFDSAHHEGRSMVVGDGGGMDVERAAMNVARPVTVEAIVNECLNTENSRARH